jgi:Na+/melibiose symporter-like transporter
MKRLGLAGYAALSLPMAMAMLPIYMISPKFYGDALGIDLAALGAVLFLTRLLDTAQDPLIGRLVDLLQRKKHGWTMLMVISAMVLAVGFVMLFMPPNWSESRLLMWLAASLIIVYAAHSLINICYLTWGARLTDDVTGRARVTAWREAFGLIGVVVASVLPGFWVSDLGARAGYQLFAWVFVGLLGLGLMVTLLLSPKPQVATGHGLEGWRHALAPKGVRRVMWFYLFNAIAVAIPATLVLFYIDDVVQMPDQAGLFLGLYFLAGMLTLPVWVAVSDRIGKARAWLAGTCMAVLALFFSGWVGTGDGLLYGLICLVSGAALGADVALPPAMLADAIPKGHRQSTGLYFGIWVLIGKFALAVAAGVALPSLKLLDYQPGQPATTGSLIVLYVFLPMIFKALATLALLPKFGEQFFSRVFARKVSSP